MESKPVVPDADKRRLDFTYDWLGRRTRKTVKTYNGTSYQDEEDRRFVYDGWNLLGEFVYDTNLVLDRRYLWGLDLSGSAQGAGGVGGLLSAHVETDVHRPSYDGNGNIVGWVIHDTDPVTPDPDQWESREYDPFGRTIVREGLLSVPFGFSTKYEDVETGLYYYGFRYYSAIIGRWLSRDPAEESGSNNLHAIVDNRITNRKDLLGLVELFQGAMVVRWGHINTAKGIIASERRVFARAFMGQRILFALNRLNYAATIFGKGGGRIQVGRGDKFSVFLGSAAVAYTSDIGLLHELIHMRNWVNKRGYTDLQEEGITHAFEAIYKIVREVEAGRVGGVRSWKNPQGKLIPQLPLGPALRMPNIPCSQLKRSANEWALAWSSGEASISKVVKKKSFPITPADFSTLKKELLVHLSCAEFAALLNKQPNARRCCIVFTCDSGRVSRKFNFAWREHVVYPAGRKLHPSLK